MLRQAQAFKSFKLRALDGDIGKAKEFYFDDKHWTVRYLVADTGGWLTGRRVLISPYALDPANEAELVLPVNLTKKQIEDSPSLASDQPVSRQYETAYYGYYGWPMYWGGAYAWGASPHLMGASPYLMVGSPSLMRDQEASKAAVRREEAWDPNLRSTSDATGHNIQALDGEIGHVEDFVIDDETWSIRYLVVDTKKWWPGQHVLVSPKWIERVSWEESKVFVNLSCEAIKGSAAYTPQSLSREYESELHHHYGRQGYWADQPVTK